MNATGVILRDHRARTVGSDAHVSVLRGQSVKVIDHVAEFGQYVVDAGTADVWVDDDDLSIA